MQTVLISGVNGFVGHHLAREMKQKGYKVMGVGQQDKVATGIGSQVDQYYRCDLTDAEQVNNLPLHKVEVVINLAGLANVAQSFSQPALYMKVNVSVLTNLGARIIQQRLSPRIITISTGAVYEATQPMPLTENSKLVSQGSPYAQSKLAMEVESQKFRQKGLDCIVARPFNHIGPGQAAGFLVPDLISQIKSAIRSKEEIKVGNLKTRRDYTDVRDVVKAYAKLASKKLNYDTYNICSGKSLPGEEILSLILKLLAPDQDIEIKTNPELIRPNDPLDIFGSADRLFSDTGWRPTIPLTKTVEDILSSD